MQPWEVDAIFENLDYIDSPQWDMTRLMMYSNCSIWSKKKMKLTDIIKFPWDDDNDHIPETEIKNEDIERLRKQAKQLIDNGSI